MVQHTILKFPMMGFVEQSKTQNITTGKIIVEDVKNFTSFANNMINVKVVYLNKSESISHDSGDAIYIYIYIDR